MHDRRDTLQGQRLRVGMSPHTPFPSASTMNVLPGTGSALGATGSAPPG